MENALILLRPSATNTWRDLVLPKEHGSWSLALEPLALGLIATSSAAGAWLSLAVIAAFFGRRPLRIAWRDARKERRRDAWRALAACGAAAVIAFGFAIGLGGVRWLPWLVPSGIAGAVFILFDLRNEGREQVAEIAGSAAFAFLPAAIAMLAGADPAAATALALVMCGRAIPTVLTVRAALRASKTGKRHDNSALIASFLAFAVGGVVVRSGLAPVMAAAALGVLALRCVGMLIYPRWSLRARSIGMMEAFLGVAFVVAVGIAWRA